TDHQIKEFMQGKGKDHSKPYVELSNRIPEFSSKQICYRWNYIKHRVTDDPFTQKEKEFISKWIKENDEVSYNIKWSRCQKKMEKKFNKFRTVDSIQRLWFTHCKHRESRVKKIKIPGTNVINFNRKRAKRPRKTTRVIPSTIVFSTFPHLQLHPHLPTLIPSFQPEINIPKMMPLF
ncbi:9637_t:CDS:2, partial [Funneliformis geosporum]